MFKNFNGFHLVDAYHSIRLERRFQPGRVFKKTVEAIVVVFLTLLLWNLPSSSFGIEGLAVADLNLLTGSYVNLSYPLANGSAVQFLRDNDIYLGNQVEQADSDRCYGVVANEDFILVCEYGCNGSDPEIVLYTRR